MRMLYTPKFLAQDFDLVGGWRAGWLALAGNPTNAVEAIGGATDVYVKIISTLKDLNEKLSS